MKPRHPHRRGSRRWSSAAQAGLCARDIVTRIDGRRLLSMEDLGGYLDAERTVGDIVDLTVLRGDDELTLKVTLGPWPDRFGQT